MGDKEKILEQLEAARLKVQQYENKIQLLQNRQSILREKQTSRGHIISAI